MEADFSKAFDSVECPYLTVRLLRCELKIELTHRSVGETCLEIYNDILL